MDIKFFDGTLMENGEIADSNKIWLYNLKNALQIKCSFSRSAKKSSRTIRLSGGNTGYLVDTYDTVDSYKGMYIIGPEHDPRDGEFREYLFESATVQVKQYNRFVNIKISGKTYRGAHVILYGGREETLDCFIPIEFTIDFNVPRDEAKKMYEYRGAKTNMS